MEIDVKRSNNKVNYISTETTTDFNVNKLDGVEKVDSVYLYNEKTNSLNKKSEREIKRYFTQSKDELLTILNEAININKFDFLEENKKIINKSLDERLSNTLNVENVIRYVGIVDELSKNPLDGEIYGLKHNNQVIYYLFLNGTYFVMMSKEQMDKNYYKKEELNSKLNELNSTLLDLTKSLDVINEDSISKDDLSNYMSELEKLTAQLDQIQKH